MSKNKNKISIYGAKVHNLKNINLEIPRNKLIVITGISGSGKSSLAFDTIYAEGQRRYMESLSSYARQFLGIMDKPDVDKIEGLSPTIAINQKVVTHNVRSTVGTITEIYDYLRLLFARVGHPHCPNCGREISQQTTDQIIEKIFKKFKGEKVMILTPLVRDKKGEYKNILREIKKVGYSFIRLDKEIYTIEEGLEIFIDKNKKHTLEVVVSSDEEIIQEKRDSLKNILKAALDLGNGLAIVSDFKKDILYSQYFSCPKCGVNLPKLEPRFFSFNSPYGACPRCEGLGVIMEIDPDLLIPNKKLTIAQGAIRPWMRIYSSFQNKILEKVAKENGFSLNIPVQEMAKKDLEIILYGTGDKKYEIEGKKVIFEGVVNQLKKKYKKAESDYIRKEIERYMRKITCPECQGKRLRPEVLLVTLGGKNIAQIGEMSVEKALQFFNELGSDNFKKKKLVREALNRKERIIARQLIQEIKNRLFSLINVGLNYLTLDRSSLTLAGGEAQRVKLATQINSALSGIIYILDEPTIGLHPRNIDHLISTLRNLKKIGNTIIVVEHDPKIIESADEIIDIGPGAGLRGGQIVVQGTLKQIIKNKNSLTGQYLSGEQKIEIPKRHHQGTRRYLVIEGASQFNLKNIDVKIPLGKFVCLTGVSGSGKSTLMIEILAKALAHKLHRAKELPGKHKRILGIQYIDKIINVDQTPIGRSPRSNPATYTGIFTYIRDLFAQLPESKIRGYTAGHFSFNVKDKGRCETCSGEGMIKIEMQFLPDVYVECEECGGKRYNQKTLEVHYKGKNIAEVLDMTVDEAREFFVDINPIRQKLDILREVGLGYIKLGQPATTLSGGEAQRVKLATELSRRATGKTLYILDEPTTGLHFDDIKKLLKVLNKLVEKGNSVLVIEHNLDVIKCADWIIDLGPEGGDKGGYVVAQGTPQQVAKIKRSYTGRYLKQVLK